MSDTSIEWTHRPGTKGVTWNPTTGCDRISPGCEVRIAELGNLAGIVGAALAADAAGVTVSA